MQRLLGSIVEIRAFSFDKVVAQCTTCAILVSDQTSGTDNRKGKGNMSYGLFMVTEKKREVLVLRSTDVAYLETMKRTFESRKQFGLLKIEVVA